MVSATIPNVGTHASLFVVAAAVEKSEAGRYAPKRDMHTQMNVGVPEHLSHGEAIHCETEPSRSSS